MEELLRKAEEVGRLLAEHPRFRALMTARDAVRADEAARKTLGEYQGQVEKIERLSAGNKPIEVEDKRRLADLEQTVASNEKIKALTRAQADFSELMSRMNRAIYEKIAPAGQTSGKEGK